MRAPSLLAIVRPWRYPWCRGKSTWQTPPMMSPSTPSGFTIAVPSPSLTTTGEMHTLILSPCSIGALINTARPMPPVVAGVTPMATTTMPTADSTSAAFLLTMIEAATVGGVFNLDREMQTQWLLQMNCCNHLNGTLFRHTALGQVAIR
jgi:hypothetical protein